MIRLTGHEISMLAHITQLSLTRPDAALRAFLWCESSLGMSGVVRDIALYIIDRHTDCIAADVLSVGDSLIATYSYNKLHAKD